MTPKYLLTIGDSWPCGAELINPRTHAFPALIANQLDAISINLSEPGTSADQSLYRLFDTKTSGIEWSKTLVLFCLSGISRSMYINRRPLEISPREQTLVSTAYYKYIHSDELDQFNRVRNILSAQQYCQQVGSPILFVNNWDKTPKHHAIDDSLFYNKTLTEILNINNKLDDTKVDWHILSSHEYISPNQYHPNVVGHNVIADELSRWIKEK
jgi:hypothetical protein